jgi:hypothetical protein
VSVEIIADADAETTVINYLETLAAALDTGDVNYQVDVASKVPNPRPARFLQVMRTGGTRRDLVTDRAQILVMASSNDEADAVSLLGWARAHINAAGYAGVMGAATCSDVNEFSGPVNFPDPNSGQYRYRASFEIDLRAESA